MSKCGTKQGMDAHKGRNEPPCVFCVRAATAPTPTPVTVKVKKPKVVKPRGTGYLTRRENWIPGEACGTLNGHGRHRKLGETPCEPCREARNAESRKHYKPRPRKPKTKCGSTRGLARHRAAGEKPCDPCRIANNEANRVTRARRRAKALEEAGS